MSRKDSNGFNEDAEVVKDTNEEKYNFENTVEHMKNLLLQTSKQMEKLANKLVCTNGRNLSQDEISLIRISYISWINEATAMIKSGLLTGDNQLYEQGLISLQHIYQTLENLG